MRTIIAGSRSVHDYLKVAMAVVKSGFDITQVVSGAARGVDTLGERWAHSEGVPVVRFLPNWDKHGKSAGIIRNAEMAKHADALVAIWDGQSRGTRHMIEEARRRGLAVYVERVEP